MKVAIIGGNLLGCATAVYTRKAHEANAAESDDRSENPDANSEITIFERLPSLGGNKFRTLTISTPTAAGTASDADLSVAPAFAQLLKDANLSPAMYPAREWAVFDWNADSYTLAGVRSRVLDAVAASSLVYFLQLFALLSTIFFGQLFFKLGIRALLKTGRYGESYLNYFYILWVSHTLLLGLGLVPIRSLFRLYSHMFFKLSPRISCGISYGGHSLSILAMHCNQTKAHFETILSRDAASSCVTTGHLLSACGLAKFAKASLTEFLSSYNVDKRLMDDLVLPFVAATYSDTGIKLTDVNALAGLLALLSRSQVPGVIHSGARYLGADESATLCDRLADAAGAITKKGVTVTKVLSKGSRWELTGIAGGKETELGVFDAVVLAAVVDPRNFTTDAVDDLASNLSLPNTGKNLVNAAKSVNLVKGNLRSQYLRQDHTNTVASSTTVVNSVNCSQIVRVGDDEWLVTACDTLATGSATADVLFESVEKIVSFEQAPRYGCSTPITHEHGDDVPTFVLGTRFLNAACTDRIANDINLDVLSAKNTASFFRNVVADWK